MSHFKQICLPAIAILGLLAPGPMVHAREPFLSDEQIRARLITESIETYNATGRPCACPYQSARNGSSCGRRSAYSRQGGAVPLCYPADVSADMVTRWRAARGQ